MQSLRSMPPDDGGAEERRRHRVRLLKALGGICRKIERLQPSGVARLACQEVADGLRQWRAREDVRPVGRRD